MVKNKRIPLLLSVASLFLMTSVVKAAEKSKTSQVNAYYYHNNNPIYSVQIQATNYDTAYKKIKNGKFENDELDHYTVDDLKKLYHVVDDAVQLSDALSFGKGIKLTEEESEKVLTVLYRDGRPFLDALNEFQPQVALHNPGNSRYRFTTEEGLAVAELSQGWTVFQSSVDSSYEVVKLNDKQETIYLGNTITDRDNITVDARKVDGYFTADIGESITYKVPVEGFSSLELEVSPHFIIDDINASYTEMDDFVSEKNGEGGILVDSKILPSKIDLEGNIFRLSKPYGELVDQEFKEVIAGLQSTKRIQIDLEGFSSNVIEITGHIASIVPYSISSILSEVDGGQIITKELLVENQNIRQGVYVKADGKYLLTPEIYSNNINFAMIDGKTHQLITGAKYILGRIDKDKQVFILDKNSSGQLEWNESRKNEEQLSELDSSFIIAGNQMIYLDGYQVTLPFNQKVWAYDEEKQTKSNEALIKLRGLSGGFTYFMSQVSAPKGYERAKKVHKFEVTRSSESQAQFGDYQANGFILDLEYGKTEYNALTSLKTGEKETKLPNPYMFAGIFIGVTILVVSGFAYLVVKRG